MGLETTCEVVSLAVEACPKDTVDTGRAVGSCSSGVKAAGGPAATAAAALAKRDRDKEGTSGAAGKSFVDTATEADMAALNAERPACSAE
jgi:hypothetical protein